VAEAKTRSRRTKGEETRRTLLDAAARLFAEKGYHATSVPDIVHEAGVGHGTFYDYFASRRAILLALTDETTGRRRRSRPRGDDLRARISAEIHSYLADHVEHRTLSKVWHQAVHFDPEIAETRRRERMRRVERVRRGIEAAGHRPEIDPAVAAAALNAMLEEFAHRWFVENDAPERSQADVDTASQTLTAMWLSVLGLA
jgi:AcrR family transcriptional regulator